MMEHFIQDGKPRACEFGEERLGELAELGSHLLRLHARVATEQDSYEQTLIEWQIEAVEALIRQATSSVDDRG